MRLNQFLALHKTGKAEGEGAITKAYNEIQKKPLLAGLTKTYSPRDQEGETLPSEGTLLQLRVPEILRDAVVPVGRLLDLQSAVDFGNQVAKADVEVDGAVILTDVPVETLLFLEKKLIDFATLVSKLPVLDAAETWVDNGDGSFKTEPSTKVRTKKVPRVLVKAPATDKHQADTEVWHEDVVVGDWTTVVFSGGITQRRQRELAAKVAKLQRAVKIAREEANSTDVPDKKIGDSVFEFLGWTE